MESGQTAKTFQMWQNEALCGMQLLHAELRDGLDDVRGGEGGNAGWVAEG